MKRVFIQNTLLTGLCLTLPVPCFADPAMMNTVPGPMTGPDRLVRDFDHALSDTAKTTLISELQTLDDRGQAQVAIVILPDTDRDLSEFAPVIFNQWGVGHAKRDDGLLILIDHQRILRRQHGNRIFVSVGTGIQGTLPDARVGRLLDDYAVPAMNAGNTEQAVLQLTQAFVDILSKEPIKAAHPHRDSGSGQTILFIIVLLLFLLMNRRRSGFLIGGPGGFYGGGDGGGNDWGGGGFGGGGSDGGGAGR